MYIAPILSGNIYSCKNVRNSHSNIRQNNCLSPVTFKANEVASNTNRPQMFLNSLLGYYKDYPVPEVNTPSKQELINDGMKVLPAYTKLFEDGDVIYKTVLDSINEIRKNVGKILKENGLDIDNFENIDKETSQKIRNMTLSQGRRPDKGYGDNPLWLESKTFPIIRLKFEYYIPEHDDDKAHLRLVHYTTEPDKSKYITEDDKSKYTDKSKSVTYDLHKHELRLHNGKINVHYLINPMELINGSSIDGKFKTISNTKSYSLIFSPETNSSYCYYCTDDRVSAIRVGKNLNSDSDIDTVLERNKLVLDMGNSEKRTYTVSDDGKTLTDVTLNYNIEKKINLTDKQK